MKNTWIRDLGKAAGILCFFGLAFGAIVQPAMAERKGAELSILRADGGQLQGELVAVRGETLILLLGVLDASVDLGEISRITVVRKSRIGTGVGIGLGLGLGAGLLTGMTSSDDPPGWFSLSRSEKGTLVGMAVGGVGVIVGLISGVIAGIDKNISMESISPEGRQRLLRDLAKWSRMGFVQ